MASINRHLPSPGSAVWRRDISSRDGPGADDNKVRHVVIRDAEIREQPSPHVVYRIDVLTEHDHWYIYHRYSHFYSLHKKLMRHHNVSRDLLPPKKLSGNLSKQLIDKRRQLLEQYLQKMIHSEVQISQSTELLEFLDVPAHDVIKVTDVLTRHLYRYGDQMLEEGTPIALSVNEMYSITKRLQLPFDASSTVDIGDVAADLAHLYGFVHQLRSLRVSPPPAPSSVSCSSFDINPFRSLNTLKLDKIPLTQIHGLVSVQQQLKKFTVHRSLHSLKELLIDAVEEKRGVASGMGGAYWSEGTPPPSPTTTEKWRLTATAKLIGSRVVVQPWHRLHTLVLSHNLLTHLDDSLQVLPALKELNLSHNQLQVIQLQHLCLPSLEKLNLSHNSIYQIQDDKKVLERITKLNLSHNRLQSLDNVQAFVGVATLQVSYNLLASRSDLDRLVELRKLTNLTLAGNPISSTNACRLILLTKFLQKSRLITLDGLEVTNKEQAKIQSLKDRHGNNPNSWPITKALIAAEQSTSQAAPPTPPSLLKAARIEPGPVQGSPKMTLSWTIHSPAGVQRRPVSQPRTVSLSSTDSPAFSRSAMDNTSTNRDATRLMTHFPKSFDHLTLSNQSDDPKEHAIFAQSLLSSQTSGGRGGKEGRFRRDVSPSSSDGEFVAGSGKKASVFINPRLRDDSLVSLPDSREEPDGQSDISSISPEAIVIQRESTPDTPIEQTDTPSICSLTPPPSTPLTANGNSFKPTITPLMIQSALTALQQIQDKDMPISAGGMEEGGHSPIFPEEVTTALTAWINQQHQRSRGSSELQTPLLSPPPSTPQRPESESTSDNHSAVVNLDAPGANVRHGISASDLIAALSSFMGQETCSTDATSGESSGVCSVPACTPKEGLNEWLRLGIHPDEVIQALTALTISREEQEVEGEEAEPIRITVPTQLVTKYEEFPPCVVVSDVDVENTQEDSENGVKIEQKEEVATVEENESITIEQGEEKREGQEVEHGAESVEKELAGEENQGITESTAPIKIGDDLTVPSEEAMGIKLLNDLSFFPDPLAAPEPTESIIRGSPPCNDIAEETKKGGTVSPAAVAIEHEQFEPSSSPLEESVLYLGGHD